MLGCFEFLLLAGGFGALFLLYRTGRITGKQLCWYGFFFLLGLAFLGLFLGSKSRAHQEKWVVTLTAAGLLIGLIALIVWAVLRWLRRASPRNCPPIGRLKELLAERLAPAEHARLAAHLEVCPACQHRVEGLTAGQKSWPGLARKLSEAPPSPEPALRKVMAQLKESNDEATGDEPVFCGDLPLGFLSPAEKPGQLGRLERYEVLEEIGRGGMGVVLKAFDPSLHRVVAIKVLAPQLATSGVARKRFLREAKAAAAVTHDHIVTIHAVDEANGLPYLVMQYVAGQSLQDRIDRDGPLELADILRIGMQTASGLAAAHAHGIVHRDIKPANILLEEGVQRVKITDFGLARAMDDASLTQSGFVAGSPLYMAPEQARGEALDHRADLFSLGSVLYTMCTGRPPFRAANTLAVLRRVSEDAPRPIRETNPEVPDWLADVVAKLMAKEPAERVQSAAEVVEVFGQHLAQLQHAAWVPPVHPPSPAGANGDAPGLPTSLTICPSCGASLHVPERMVGSLVHCSECGKPFHVEEGSEVMQVVQPVRWPLGARCRAWRKRPRWVWIAGGCLVLPLLLVLLFGLMLFISYESVRVAPPVSATRAPEEGPGHPPGYWMSTLNGLPPEATVFGAIELPPSQQLTLDDASMRTLLPLLVPRETAGRLTPENLGRVRISSAALGYYDESKNKDARLIVNLRGVALDGHKRIVEFLRRGGGDKVQIEELDGKLGANGPVCVSSPERPFALKIIDDNDAYLAVSLRRDAKATEARKMLDKLPSTTWVSASYHPPWFKTAVPLGGPGQRDVCGFVLGEIPAAWQKRLTEILNLHACPRTFNCHLKRERGGIALYLTLNMDRPEAARLLRDDLEKARQQGLDRLLAQYPELRNEPQALAEVRRVLNSMHWIASGDSVISGPPRTQVPLSAKTWTALLALAKRLSQ